MVARLGPAARNAGSVLITLAILLLGFLGYCMWLTGVSESSSQHSLVAQIETALPNTLGKVAAGTPLVPSGPVSPAPTSTHASSGAWLGVLVIPRIHQRAVIVEGTGRRQLSTGPGHYVGTAVLGGASNSAVAGHRTTYGAPFAHLDQLQRGDAIVVTTSRAAYLYRVERSEVVTPTDVSVLNGTTKPTLTLTTCTPAFSASHRLVVIAVMRATTLFAQPSTVTGHAEEPINALVSANGGGGWWSVVLFGTLLSLLLSLGSRWWRRSSRRTIVIIVIIAMALPVTLVLYGALANLLPESL